MALWVGRKLNTDVEIYLSMVSIEGFISEDLAARLRHSRYFSHWLFAETSHCLKSTWAVSKSPSTPNAIRNESTNWWGYMLDLATDSPPSSSLRPINTSGSIWDWLCWNVKEAYILWHAFFCHLCTRFYDPGDIGGGTCCTIVWGAVWFSTA